MKDPCINCVVGMICVEMCSLRHEYTNYFKDDLQYFLRRLKGHRNDVEDFDKKYYQAHLKYEEIFKENERKFSSTSTTSSGLYFWSTSSSSSSKEWIPKEKKNKKEYLKGKRI
jgi:hypothetical protein